MIGPPLVQRQGALLIASTSGKPGRARSLAIITYGSHTVRTAKKSTYLCPTSCHSLAAALLGVVSVALAGCDLIAQWLTGDNGGTSREAPPTVTQIAAAA